MVPTDPLCRAQLLDHEMRLDDLRRNSWQKQIFDATFICAMNICLKLH